jgi:CDP-paratose 2-epimerase
MRSEIRSVVVFGGAGFIGSNWTERLLRTTGARVHVFDNLSRSGSRHNLEHLREVAEEVAGAGGRLQVTVGDVRDAALVCSVLRDANEIYHFAAQVAVTTSLDNPRLDFEVNLGGTFNVLEGARQHGKNPFLLFTSTNKVYGNLSIGETVGPRGAGSKGCDERRALDFHSPYGCSKGAADQYVRDYARIYGLRSVVFRMSCIAGPRQAGSADQGWVAHFLYSALEGRPLTIYGDGRQVRDVLHVDDLLRAFEAAYARRRVTSGQIYNIGGGTGNAVSLHELMERVEQLTGERLDHDFAEARAGDQVIYISDHSKFSRHTGWQPKADVDEVLSSIHEWYLGNRQLLAGLRLAPAEPAGALSPLPRSA